MATEQVHSDSWKQTYQKEVRQLQEKYKNLYNWTVRLLPYVVLLVGSVVGGRVWQAYLSDPERCTDLDVLLKGSIESSLFANIVLMMGLLYVAFLLFVHVCLYRPRWWHIPVYVILATYLCVIPLWNPIDTAIPGVSYPGLVAAGCILVGICELSRLLFRHYSKEAFKKLSDGTDGFVVKADDQETIDPDRENFIDTFFNLIGWKQLEKESFAIGIAGSWGSGKTTFYDAVKRKIEADDKFVLCEFKPWQILEPARIAPDFFDDFVKAIKRKDSQWKPQLYNSLAKYAQMLTEVPQLSSWAQFVNVCFGSGPKDTVEELRDEIERLLGNQKTYVAVMIDDLDRLNKDELLEIMRLVRASANFKHVLFILVYDKKHFVKELGDKGDVEYLKKIVNVEFNLPLLENYKYRDLLFNNIKKVVPGLDKTPQLEELKKACRVANSANDNILLTIYSHNFRDLLRFSNHFGLIMRHLQKQELWNYFNIRDLFWLEILYYYEEDVYSQLQSPLWALLKMEEDPLTKQQYLTLRENKEDEKKALPVGDVLNELFNPSKREHANSIVWRNNFNNYFAHRLLDNAVSIPEFANLMEYTEQLEDVEKQIIDWYKGHARISFLNVIKNYPHNNAFVSELAFKNYIHVLYFLLRTKEIKEFNIAELKNILHIKCRASYFRLIDEKKTDKTNRTADRAFMLLREHISQQPGIEWNYLLTAMCPMSEEDFVGRQDYKKRKYLIKRKNLIELAILNYKCYVLQKRKKTLNANELFHPNKDYTRFIVSLSYLSKVFARPNGTYKVYDNLIGAYVLEQLDNKYNNDKLDRNTFANIYKNLRRLANVNNQMDTEARTRAIRKAIEQTLGSVRGFEEFLQKHFDLGERNIKLCKDMGLNVKQIDIDE